MTCCYLHFWFELQLYSLQYDDVQMCAMTEKLATVSGASSVNLERGVQLGVCKYYWEALCVHTEVLITALPIKYIDFGKSVEYSIDFPPLRMTYACKHY
jgi:hypothetical protein